MLENIRIPALTYGPNGMKCVRSAKVRIIFIIDQATGKLNMSFIICHLHETQSV